MLPPELSTVTVTGTYLHPGGKPFQGRVTFTPEPAVLTSAAGDVIILGDVDAEPDVTGHLRPVDSDGTGDPGVTLLATDDPLVTPTGWTYRVVERWWDAKGRDYPLSLPLAAPTVDLADVAPTAAAEGEYVVVSGPAGPVGPPINTYQHTQGVPAATWQVNHQLGRKPNISVIDGSGRVCLADIDHASLDLAVITFPAAFSGIAVCS